jgi:hypothetical protein
MTVLAFSTEDSPRRSESILTSAATQAHRGQFRGAVCSTRLVSGRRRCCTCSGRQSACSRAATQSAKSMYALWRPHSRHCPASSTHARFVDSAQALADATSRFAPARANPRANHVFFISAGLCRPLAHRLPGMCESPAEDHWRGSRPRSDRCLRNQWRSERAQECQEQCLLWSTDAALDPPHSRDTALNRRSGTYQ